MLQKKNLTKINNYLWEIPKSFRKDMRVPARIYVDEKMLDSVFKDKSLEQLVNLTALPGIEKYSLVMPDVHEGYGSPIGGVFATRVKEDGIISPGAVGYDINCGVRLLKSNLSVNEISSNLDNLATEIQRIVPSGLGKGHLKKLDIKELDRILENGAQEIVKQGYGKEEDIKNCEANGKLELADVSEVSDTAKKRGRDQVGTLGSGNHFLEIQKVEEIFDDEVAKTFGLHKDHVVIMIHTGSRGLGHQIATDYIRLMLRVMPKYGIKLLDRELACAPFNSPEGQRYFKAMSCGANFAWANRQMITHYIRQSWERVLSNQRPTTNDLRLSVLYDVAHNIAKLEGDLLVHRKGATRAFPGQPVLIPGSMGTASYILQGTKESEQAFFSSCHGAGRIMSRHKAIKTISGKEVIKDLENKGILIKCYSLRGVAEEAPMAYKDVDNVVEVVHQAGLSKKVARLKPLAVIKGE
ncbi:MAG TPA: RtcB family protein [Candidatus Wolfebacteria bacterium]|nr:RtcB family protein [Candidatus Wolfebacteria bacterium]